MDGWQPEAVGGHVSRLLSHHNVLYATQSTMVLLGFGRAGLFHSHSHSHSSAPPICTVEVLPRHRVWYLKPKEPMTATAPGTTTTTTTTEDEDVDAPPPRSVDTVIDGHVIVGLELPRRIDEMHVELVRARADRATLEASSYPAD